MAEVSRVIAVIEPSQGQKSPEVELRLAAADVLTIDEPIATEARAVPTISDLLAEAEPVV